MQSDSTQTVIQNLLTTTPPSLSPAAAVRVAASHYGIRAQVRPLVSDRDQNFRLDAHDGRRYTLKISNHAEQLRVVDFQNRALLHVAKQDPSMPVPRVISTSEGQLHCCVEHAGKTHLVRVLSWLEGDVLDDNAASAGLANQLGRLLARLGLALKDFDHPGSDSPLLWDMKRAADLRSLLVHIEDHEILPLISQTLDRFVSRVKPTLDNLRTQVIYNDMNPANVLMDQNHPGRISGLIDFGDLVKSPLIIDLAIAAAYQLGGGDDPLAGALPLIAGYHALRPLLSKEKELLTDLIRTRLITSLLIGAYRAKLFPANSEYLLISQQAAKNSLINLSRCRANEALERIQAACPGT